MKNVTIKIMAVLAVTFLLNACSVEDLERRAQQQQDQEENQFGQQEQGLNGEENEQENEENDGQIDETGDLNTDNGQDEMAYNNYNQGGDTYVSPNTGYGSGSDGETSYVNFGDSSVICDASGCSY